ncbi:Bug family tripartite tricarboxylate transporter substrate binding protein [Ramlibacter tataouinensis]|uniref:Extracytoplasmic binding receptor-like protein n=1 Tax=Ramlibacter tataouinensis (strain ATCC BAA-407 / DSM 14655 / LMG 21543 / TTB310) TaxID=365046 RepID=F5Y1S9_RAMTT|nr:tripartite tricarboxylate transporter substrate binding protein [Ramlibacter tataouinensis]AEG92330.1 extracytoplasmic binding receptor-like protein [Ramlibacter tataouinensis TTB310]
MARFRPHPAVPPTRRSWLRAALAAAGLAVLHAPAFATPAAWQPERPIRLVVPYGPGGSSDVIARLLAAEMARTLGQSVVVDNKGGGSGLIAMQEVARAAPDGHTLVLGHVGTLAVNPAMLDKLPYSDKDFEPIGLLAKVPMVFATGAKVPAKTLPEFIAYAKAHPGKLTYGSAGNGSAGHLAFEMLKVATGMDVTHIPYKGTGAQLNDLLAGTTDAASAGPPGFMQHVKAGRIRIIASGSAQRLAALPEVPTVAEQGYPGFDSSQWFGLLAPARTPAHVVARIHAAAEQALQVPAVQERLKADATLASPMNGPQFAAFIKAERERWGEVVRKSKLKAE